MKMLPNGEKPISMPIQMTFYSENLSHEEVAQWRKTYIHAMKMTLYSENLNHAEVARWRKPISMLCK